MPTTTYESGLKAMINENPEMAIEMLEDAVNAMMSGDLDDGRLLLRQYIKATTGFAELGRQMGKDDKNLMRSLRASGNPTASNLFAILHACTEAQGVKIAAHLVPQADNSAIHT